MKQAKRKLTNKIKLIIVVSIILLLLVILFANRNKILKLNQMAGVGYNVTINQITIDISNVITSTPNVPVLGAGMIPIKWNENAGVWEITTPNDSNWYDYDNQIWANIVVRNNEKEAYFVWIPRYEYKLDSTNERSRVILIPKSKTTADSGYQIPEAFIWNGTQISGYWMSKYQLGT